MTYRELYLEIKNNFSEEQKDMDVTIFDTDNEEYYKVNSEIKYTETDDVLDKNHPIIEL